MDASVLPPGLVEIGPAGLNVYARAPGRPGTAAEQRRPPSARPPAPPRPLAPGIAGPAPVPAAFAPPPPALAFEPIALHLRALTLLERGDLAGADALLEKVRSFAPDYLAGLLQLALLRDRAGRRGEAARIMRDLLARTAAMPRDERIPGPEELSAGYLLASARAYLGGEGGRT
jgi:chemotaxis protein methyltransferase CheR